MINNANSSVSSISALEMNTGAQMNGGLTQHYTVECFDAEGNLKWVEDFDNLVVTTGLNKYLDMTLYSGIVTPLWYVGLKGAGAVAAGDTLATPISWTENTTAYSGNRPAYTPVAASAGSTSNTASKAVFNITGTATIAGALLANVASGTSGILLGAGDFSAGSRSVLSGDILNVTITCSLTSS